MQAAFQKKLGGIRTNMVRFSLSRSLSSQFYGQWRSESQPKVLVSLTWRTKLQKYNDEFVVRKCDSIDVDNPLQKKIKGKGLFLSA